MLCHVVLVALVCSLVREFVCIVSNLCTYIRLKSHRMTHSCCDSTIFYSNVQDSSSRCLSWVSSYVLLSIITTKFYIGVRVINSSIFGGSDCTFSMSTLSRLLVVLLYFNLFDGNFPSGGVSTVSVLIRSLWHWCSLLIIFDFVGYGCPWVLQ